jgi:hypothetical protein
MRRPKVVEGPEPRVVAADLARILHAAVYRPMDPLEVDVVAARAGLHRRTVYRWLEPKKTTAPLDTADRLLMAVGADLRDVRVVPGGPDAED